MTPASWSAAAKEWRWLAMVRKWRAVTRRSEVRARGEEAMLVEVPLPSGVLEVVWATEGVEESAEEFGQEWWWLHLLAEMRLYPGGGGGEAVGPGLWERVALARRRIGWGGSRHAIGKLLGWEVAAGRAESSNGMWVVAEVLEVVRPTGRHGMQLEVHVRWAGEQPVTRLPWGEQWVPITGCTEDIKKKARAMERERYGEASDERRPLKRGREERLAGRCERRAALEGGRGRTVGDGGGDNLAVRTTAEAVSDHAWAQGIQLTGPVEGMPWGQLGVRVEGVTPLSGEVSGPSRLSRECAVSSSQT